MSFCSVLIVDKDLYKKNSIEQPGLYVNVALVLGLTSGRLIPNEFFGPDVADGDGAVHKFLTNQGHNVKEASQAKISSLRTQLAAMDGVTVVDYTVAALPPCYETYQSTLSAQRGNAIVYLAIHVFGPHELVFQLTKNLNRLGK